LLAIVPGHVGPRAGLVLGSTHTGLTTGLKSEQSAFSRSSRGLIAPAAGSPSKPDTFRPIGAPASTNWRNDASWLSNRTGWHRSLPLSNSVRTPATGRSRFICPESDLAIQRRW